MIGVGLAMLGAVEYPMEAAMEVRRISGRSEEPSAGPLMDPTIPGTHGQETDEPRLEQLVSWPLDMELAWIARSLSKGGELAAPRDGART